MKKIMDRIQEQDALHICVQSQQAADGAKCGWQKSQYTTRLPLLHHTESQQKSKQGKILSAPQEHATAPA